MFLYSEIFSTREYNLTDEELRYLESNPVIKVANEMDWPPFDYNEFGKPKGLAIDYIEMVCSKIGLEIDFVSGYTWTELLHMFENREIDVMPVMYKNSERESYTLYTEPYYIGKLGLFTQKNDIAVLDQMDLINKRVGIQTSHGSIPFIKETIPGIDLIEIDTTTDLVKDLALNKLDAIIGNPLLFYYNSREYQITNIELKSYISFEGYYDSSTYMHIGIRNDKPKLHRIISKVSQGITDEEVGVLIEKWTRYNYQQNTHKSYFTKAELDYLSENNLVLLAEPNRMPYQGFDSSGNLTGILSDYIKVIEDLLEYKFKVIPTDSYIEYKMELDKPFIGINISEINEESSVTPSNIYIESPIVIATNSDQIFIENFNDYTDQNITVLKESRFTNKLIELYPEINITYVDTVYDGLLKVQKREVFGYIDSAAVIGHHIQKHLITDVKIAGSLSYNRQMVINVNDNNSTLYNIINKSLAHINKDDRKRIYNKWVAVKYEKGTDYSLLIKVVLLFLAALIISLYWNKKLVKSRNETKEAIKALHNAHHKLELKNHELEVLSNTDNLTGLSNRLKLDDVLKNEIIRFNRTGNDLSLIMIDIDFFKKINDQYGHLKGDSVLKDVAHIIKNSIRVTDLSGRWGGEEFLVICPDTDKDGAKILAEKIRGHVEHKTAKLKPSLTISLGVAKIVPGDLDVDLIRKADTALYRAKNLGRNRVGFTPD